VATLNPLGNFIFNPFLGVFLVLSVLIFLAQLLMLPFSPLAWSLDRFVSIWLEMTTWLPWDWFLTFKRPPLLVALAIPVATLFIMHYRPFKPGLQKLGALTLLFMVTGTVLSLQSVPDRKRIKCGCGMIEICKKAEGLCVHDSGGMRRAVAAESWLDFVLMPELVTSFGTGVIDRYYLDRLTPSAVAYLKLLCEKNVVRNLVIPHHAVKSPIDKRLLHELRVQAIKSGALVSII